MLVLPDGDNDHINWRVGVVVVLVLRHRLHGHADSRRHERRGLHNLRNRLLQDVRRLGDVHVLPDGHDDLDHGRNCRHVVLVLRHRLHGHAHGRRHKRHRLHCLPGGHDHNVGRLDGHLVVLVVRRWLLRHAD